jgi:hypothetical protein
MSITTHRNKSVEIHKFSMVPNADIPRSTFQREWTHKTTFDENYLVPIYVDEVLPGDTFSLRMTAFARMTTPIFPIMDNMYLDTFFFFVPNRIVWNNWVKFMGEQVNPGDSITYTIPQMASPTSGYPANSLFDYMGLPTVGQITGGLIINHSTLPIRAYALIYDQWFRDENFNISWYPTLSTNGGDGPDLQSNITLLKRGKRHDYFTSALPWTQKQTTPVSFPLIGNATVKTNASNLFTGVQTPMKMLRSDTGAAPGNFVMQTTGPAAGDMAFNATAGGAATAGLYPANLYADLSTVAAITINQLRQSFQIQRLLERDARGGTRYVETIRAHFGVVNPDFRMQRPEYLGGGTTPINIAPIPQTAQTGLTGGATPLGTLGAYGTTLARGHGFTQSFTEHGHVIGLANVRADITYQQGLRKLWSRSTRYDFYYPVFAHLGEQAILNQEIYCVGNGAIGDTLVFGYQERWAEYRYFPSYITGQFKSTTATPLDAWHLAEKFTALPTLGSTFIQMNTPVARVSAVPTANTHFIFDSFFQCKTTRAMPLYSVPGLVDHF